MNNESFDERLLKANQKLLDAIDMLDPTDPEAGEMYRNITALWHELNADTKTKLENEQKKEELKVEREKIKTEAKTKAEAIKAERERTRSESKSDFFKTIVDIVTKLAMAAATGASVFASIWMFKRSSAFEDEGAYLKETDKTIIRNGLSGRFFD